MPTTNLAVLERTGRDIAAAHLDVRGFKAIARDATTRYGALDIVATDGDTLLFASVAVCRPGTRSVEDPIPAPAPAVMRRRAAAWLATATRPAATRLRFDAIAVVVDRAGRLVSLSHDEHV
jgi:putative endonuclease